MLNICESFASGNVALEDLEKKILCYAKIRSADTLKTSNGENMINCFEKGRSAVNAASFAIILMS